MFRELIRPAVPQIIDLLSHRELNVRMAGADALSKLSEQGNISQFSELNNVDVLFVVEFQVSISVAIPQIITFLKFQSHTGICEAGANALVTLSEQGKVSKFLI